MNFQVSKMKKFATKQTNCYDSNFLTKLIVRKVFINHKTEYLSNRLLYTPVARKLTKINNIKLHEICKKSIYMSNIPCHK